MKNLLNVWDDLTRPWLDKKLILFLDYDGTLSPIAPSPSLANFPPENKQALERLIKNSCFKVVIISGRSLADLKEMVGLEGVIYIGNHGWEIRGDSMHFESLVPPHISSMMRRVKYELITQLSDIPGVFVEDKGITLGVHYRLASRNSEFLVKRIFDHTIMPYRRRNELRVQFGKKILELRPPMEWDKGKAALWLLRKQEIIEGKGNILPVYIGDDTTDEEAFEALRQKGITVLVGPPRTSEAQYYLQDTYEVTRFLNIIADSKAIA